jgi:hypothetical protein
MLTSPYRDISSYFVPTRRFLSTALGQPSTNQSFCAAFRALPGVRRNGVLFRSVDEVYATFVPIGMVSKFNGLKSSGIVLSME